MEKTSGNDLYFKILHFFVHLLIYLNTDMIEKYIAA